MKYGFGVDVGGTAVKMGLFDRDGSLLQKWEIATRIDGTGSGILPDIAAQLCACMEAHGLTREQILGVGIGVPGPVSDAGVVNRCVNLNWGVFNLHDRLRELTGLRIKGGNDANVAALGEYYCGGGSGCRSMVLMTLGTGIGGGIVLDGKILDGAHGSGGEIGHIVVNPAETQSCSCGKYGCIEQYGSATGVVRTAKRLLAECAAPSVLRDLGEFTCKDVFDSVAAGDELAAQTLEITFDLLGLALANACCVCDPERIVIGGGVSAAGQVLLDGVAQAFERHKFHACAGTQFALASLGNDAGIYGAFYLARETFRA